MPLKIKDKTKIGLLVLSLLLSTASYAGPSVSGGGNGLDGKPLESFAVDITKTQEFREGVAPVLYQLGQKLPELKQDLEKVIQDKNVYLVPALLPTIPSYVLGVSFKTEQLALQTERSIWIDSVIYSQMAVRDRSLLLMHELVMGLRLSVQSSAWECTPSDRNRYCRGTDLDRQDYESVRRLTYVLMNSLDKNSATQLSGLVSELGFGDYEALVQVGQPAASLSIGDLYLALLSEDRQGALPYRTSDQKGCAYEFQYDSTAESLSVSIYGTEGGLPRRDRAPFAVKTQGPLTVTSVRNAVRYSYVEKTPRQLGAFRKRLEIYLNDSGFSRISTYWEECTFDYRDKSLKWVESPSGPATVLVRDKKVCVF